MSRKAILLLVKSSKYTGVAKVAIARDLGFSQERFPCNGNIALRQGKNGGD